MRYVRQFADLGRGDVAEAGGKGANLGELTRAGFPVPPGFVLTTAAYRAFVAAAGIGERVLALAGSGDAEEASTRIRALFAAAPVPDDVADELRSARAALGPAVAVRSSATAEDLPGASYAGQHDTFLDVRGDGAVLDAVREASLELGVALSENLTEGVFVNQSAAFSDFHATGANAAANAALTDGNFVSGRFTVVQSRRHVPAEA